MYYDTPEFTVVSKWKWQLDNCYEIVRVDRATLFALPDKISLCRVKTNL